MHDTFFMFSLYSVDNIKEKLVISLYAKGMSVSDIEEEMREICTMAMDFWASLEHKIYYKFEGNAPEYISRDLRECSGIVSMLDDKMLSLNEAIIKAKEEQEKEKHT